jgi:hypothetical protein
MTTQPTIWNPTDRLHYHKDSPAKRGFDREPTRGQASLVEAPINLILAAAVVFSLFCAVGAVMVLVWLLRAIAG